MPNFHLLRRKRDSVGPQRLIKVSTLKLVEFKKYKVVPSYAILSHRWIQGEEVSYHEFSKWPRSANTKSKSGYRKIAGACAQARLDGIDYVWVDTCCIDKGNHDDVARNIKSMYAYYQNATICYAYLVDVTSDIPLLPKRFLNSEWFKRGWTLQELLAPRKVMFFNERWVFLGDKKALKHPISYLTSIPPEIISGERSVHEAAPLERMSWTIGRRTTRPPDRAYCLLGLLDVTMEPDYNETMKESMERLRKTFVETHPHHSAAFDSDECSFLDILDGAHDQFRSTRDWDMDTLHRTITQFYGEVSPTSRSISLILKERDTRIFYIRRRWADRLLLRPMPINGRPWCP